jgi:hypothetical protein
MRSRITSRASATRSSSKISAISALSKSYVAGDA